MSSPPSPSTPSKILDDAKPINDLDINEPPDSPEPSTPGFDEHSGGGEEDGSKPSEDAAGEPDSTTIDEDPKVEAPPSFEIALVWYAGLLREISPFDEAIWDYDTDLEDLTKREKYTLPVDIDSDFYDEMKERVDALPIEQVEAEAEAGDLSMQVELALRLICGLPIKSDSERAETILKAICRRDNDEPEVRPGRAAAERLDAWLDSFMYYGATVDSDVVSLDALYCAGRRCARALWIETVLPQAKPPLISSPICPMDLRVADSLFRHVEKGDFKGRDLDPSSDTKFEKLRLVWLDYTVKRYVFLRYGPRAKMCAHGPCESRGTEEKPLFRCEGKCLPQWKPLYCSKECQEKEAKQHRKLCSDTILSKMSEKTLVRSLYSTAQVVGPLYKRSNHVEKKIDRDVWMLVTSRVMGYGPDSDSSD